MTISGTVGRTGSVVAALAAPVVVLWALIAASLSLHLAWPLLVTESYVLACVLVALTAGVGVATYALLTGRRWGTAAYLLPAWAALPAVTLGWFALMEVGSVAEEHASPDGSRTAVVSVHGFMLDPVWVVSVRDGNRLTGREYFLGCGSVEPGVRWTSPSTIEVDGSAHDLDSSGRPAGSPWCAANPSHGLTARSAVLP